MVRGKEEEEDEEEEEEEEEEFTLNRVGELVQVCLIFSFEGVIKQDQDSGAEKSSESGCS